MNTLKNYDVIWTEDHLKHMEVIKHLMITHHERLNGTGPEGFKDSELDKILRMATIVDAIDGKTKVKSMHEIFADMTGNKHAGQFDLYLVDRSEKHLRSLAPAPQRELANSLNP